MKITASKSELIKSINIVLRAVPSKTTMNILNCILIDASVDEIRLTANDMELGIETIVQGTILQRGIICLDAKLLSEIVRKLPDAEVVIETDDNYQTLITSENSVFHIVGKDPSEFPHLPLIEKEDPVVLSQFQLREIIRQTIFSIALNDSNRILTGEYLEIRENELRIVGLDGHRIAIRQLTLDKSYHEHKVIIPGKTLSELMKILTGEQDDLVSLYFTRNEILFEMDGTVVISRLIEGNYFRIDQMLSNDYETTVVLKKTDFMNSVDRAMLFTSEAEKRPLVLSVESNNINMKINSQLGSMSDTLEIEKEGKDLKIGFNPKFILDALRVIDDEKITVYFLNAKAPCFIKDEEQSYIYMVLPVNFVN
jgi:DNA polymerase-3 subunit beta